MFLAQGRRSGSKIGTKESSQVIIFEAGQDKAGWDFLVPGAKEQRVKLPHYLSLWSIHSRRKHTCRTMRFGEGEGVEIKILMRATMRRFVLTFPLCTAWLHSLILEG